MMEELQAKILTAVEKKPAGVSEYDLLQSVKDLIEQQVGDSEGSVGLFRHHFVLMHCLYQLQQTLWLQNQQVLSISPLCIKIEIPVTNNHNSVSQPEDTELKQYYLDWNNFESMGKDDVDDLLSGFWQDYAKYIQQDEAWEILGLPDDSAITEVAKRYRALAAIHHPDKGGDKDMFIKIRAAYESLKLVIK